MLWLKHAKEITNRHSRGAASWHLYMHRTAASIMENLMEALLDVISVKAHDDYTLELEFENGETRIFDMKPYLDKKPFVKLFNSPLFFKASVQYGTVVWPGNIDIAPETLWFRSEPIPTTRSTGHAKKLRAS